MRHPFITVGFTTRRYSVIIHSQFASTMTHLPPHALAAPIAAGAGRARTDRAPPNHPLNAYGLWRLRVSSPGVLSAPERPSHQRLQRHLLPCARVRRQAHGRGVPVWRPGIILREAISYQKRALGLLKNGIAAQAVVLRAKENQARVGYE
jgi:hypothetical protein